jgi:hypothetical protein
MVLQNTSITFRLNYICLDVVTNMLRLSLNDYMKIHGISLILVYRHGLLLLSLHLVPDGQDTLSRIFTLSSVQYVNEVPELQ